MAVILPDSASVSLRDSGVLSEPLRNAFPGDSIGGDKARLAAAFDEAFWSGFSPAVEYVIPLLVPDSVPRAPADRSVRLSEPARIGTPAREFAAPDSAWLAGYGITADLVLVIGSVSASDERREISSVSSGGSVSVMTNKLLLGGNYLLWDYPARRAVAHGRFLSKVEYGNALGAEDWMRAFDKAVASVGSELPFRGPKWYRRSRH